MRHPHPRALVAALLLALSVAGGCRREEEPAQEGAAAADGLSRDQIEERAEAMSPEQAEQMGIVDSTIHVEQLTSPEDSALIGRDTARGDTAR
jgi:hypothetical protein